MSMSRLRARLGRIFRSLGRRSRRLRSSREGKYFIAITIGVGLAAINTGNNLLFLLLGWMCSVIVASGVLSELSLRGLSVTRQPPARIFAGRPFLMGISLKNHKGKLPSFSIEIEDLLIGGKPPARRPSAARAEASRHAVLLPPAPGDAHPVAVVPPPVPAARALPVRRLSRGHEVPVRALPQVARRRAARRGDRLPGGAPGGRA